MMAAVKFNRYSLWSVYCLRKTGERLVGIVKRVGMHDFNKNNFIKNVKFDKIKIDNDKIEIYN